MRKDYYEHLRKTPGTLFLGLNLASSDPLSVGLAVTQTGPLKPSWHFCLDPGNLPGVQGWGTSHGSAGGITLGGSLVEGQDFSGMCWRDVGMKGMEGWRGLSRASWPSPHTRVSHPCQGMVTRRQTPTQMKSNLQMEWNKTRPNVVNEAMAHYISPAPF